MVASTPPPLLIAPSRPQEKTGDIEQSGYPPDSRRRGVMFVRTVYATGDPARIDTAIRALNSQGRDLLEERPGYRGAGVFADRTLGKLLAGSWWESEDARRNSDVVMRERRGALLEPFAATTAVDNYESLVFHAVRKPEATAQRVAVGSSSGSAATASRWSAAVGEMLGCAVPVRARANTRRTLVSTTACRCPYANDAIAAAV